MEHRVHSSYHIKVNSLTWPVKVAVASIATRGNEAEVFSIDPSDVYLDKRGRMAGTSLFLGHTEHKLKGAESRRGLHLHLPLRFDIALRVFEDFKDSALNGDVLDLTTENIPLLRQHYDAARGKIAGGGYVRALLCRETAPYAIHQFRA